MPFRRLLASGLAATLALSVGLMFCGVGQARADEAGKEANSSRAATGRKERAEKPLMPLPRFVLASLPNRGYGICFSGLLESQPFDLLSVDGQTLSYQSLAQVREMILGSASPTVQFEVLSSDGSLKLVTFERTVESDAVRKVRSQSNYSILADVDQIDSGCGSFSDSVAVERGLDMFIRAKVNQSLKGLRRFPEPWGNSLNACVLRGALRCYQMGDFRAADNYMEIFFGSQNEHKRLNLSVDSSLCDDVLKTLIFAGRSGYARKFFQVRFGGGQVVCTSLELISALKTVLVSQAPEEDAIVPDALERLYELLISPQVFAQSEREWLASYLKEKGKCEESSALYMALIKERTPLFREQSSSRGSALSISVASRNIFLIQELAFDYYQLALLRFAARDLKEAERLLVNASNLYKAEYSTNQNTLLENLPRFFPKTSDINKALDKVRKGECPDDVSVVSQNEEPWIKCNPPIPYRTTLGSLAAYEKIRACYTYILEGKEDLALGKVDELIGEYRRSEACETPVGSYVFPSVLLNLARVMSDRGWFNSSNIVLKKLDECCLQKGEDSPAKVFLWAEKACNSQFAGENSKEIWDGFELNYHLARRPSRAGEPERDFVWSERLRKLAVVYYYAGDLRRAEVLIKKALSCVEAERDKVSYSREGPEGEHILLFLDAACIASKLRRFTEADVYLNDVLERKAVCGEAYGEKFSELADTYSSAGKKAQAESFLHRASGKGDLMAGGLSKPCSQPNRGGVAIDYALARLLVSDGRYSEARFFCHEAIKILGRDATREQLLLAAKCAEEMHDYAAASNYSYLASKSTSDGVRFSHQDCEYFVVEDLRRALADSDKALGADRHGQINILLDLAGHLSYSSEKDSVSYYARAYELMPDGDVRKISLARKIANFRDDFKACNSVYLKESLKLRKSAAEQAISINSGGSGDLLLELASSEVSQKLFDEGIGHARQGIARFSKDTLCPLFSREVLIPLLIKAGKHKEAEDLLLEAVVKAKAITGDGSKQTLAQLFLLFDFYIWENKKEQACAVLERFLCFNPNEEPTVSSNLQYRHYQCYGVCHVGEHLDRLRDMALAIVSGKYWKRGPDFRFWSDHENPCRLGAESEDIVVSKENFELGLLILNKVLTRQKEVLGPDDARLVATYVGLANVYCIAKNYHASRRYFDKALRIAKSDCPEEFAVLRLGTGYKYVLNKLGDKRELKKLAAPLPSYGHGCIEELKGFSPKSEKREPDLTMTKLCVVGEEIRKKDFRRSEELMLALERYCRGLGGSRQKVLGRHYFSIAELYLDAGNPALAEVDLIKGLDTAGGWAIAKYSQPLIFNLVTAYFKAGDYDRASHLMRCVVKKFDQVVDLEPRYKIDARVMLSEVLIQQSHRAKGKNEASRLKGESELVFQQALAALKRVADPDFGQIARAVAMHNLYLTKPALADLALEAPIDYREATSGWLGYVWIPHKYPIILWLHHEPVIAKESDGALLILVDGKRLAAHAGDYLDKGNLLQSYNALLAGLRANPDSQGFAVLGEYWYIQGEYTKALQACDEALEMETANYYALGVRAIVNAKLGNRQQAEKDAKAVLDGLKTVTTTTDKLTKAFALMVLSDYDGAIALLSELNEPESKSWRALFFRQQCYEVSGKKDLAAADADLLKQWQGKFEKATN